MSRRFTIQWPEDDRRRGVVLLHPKSKGRTPIVFPNREFLGGSSTFVTRFTVLLQRFDGHGPPELLAAFDGDNGSAALDWAIQYTREHPECDLCI